MNTGCLFWGSKFCEKRNFHLEFLHNSAHVNINNKDSYLQSDANMGLLKYLKNNATPVYCLKQAENRREDLHHILNAAQSPLPNSASSSVLFPGENLTGKSRKLTGLLESKTAAYGKRNMVHYFSYNCIYTRTPTKICSRSTTNG